MFEMFELLQFAYFVFDTVPPVFLAVVNCIWRKPRPDGRATKPVYQPFILNLQPSEEHFAPKNIREPPFPQYIVLPINGRYRSKKLVDELHGYAVSVSSFRIMKVTSDLYHLVVERAKDENVLCW